MSLPKFSGQVDLRRLFDPGAARQLVGLMPVEGLGGANNGEVFSTVLGVPQFDDEDAARAARALGSSAGVLACWGKYGTGMTSKLRGGYAIMLVDATRGCVFLAVDRFAQQSLCYVTDGQTLSFAERADHVAGRVNELDPQALFDYLYFHMIPAPRTIFRNVRRLPAAHSLLVDSAGTHECRHWPLKFDEQSRQPFPQARDQLRSLIAESVEEAIANQPRVGAFLSGGTDSSTVAGMLCKATGKAAPTYSIGFEAEGYDEMAYARLAAKHFGSDHHEYYVTPADLLVSIPAVAQHHDQPFGNSSALPAYYCAKMAAQDGCSMLLAGDGGDELFGGNTRYATQQFLDHYQAVPAVVKRMVEPFCGDASPLRRIPGLRQATGYVRHARAPMPQRMHQANLLMQLGPENVLNADLLAQVDTTEPARHMQDTWNACSAGSIVNRMLAYDWRYTLADSDLPKVRGATEMAAIAVAYPLLADRLVDFSMGLPPDWKVRGYKLRWFFKEALRGFLPEEIIRKKKQGFGLPHGAWTARDPQLRQLARDSLHSLARRGVVQSAFVTDLIDRRLPEHPGYYGEMIWILMMLDQWLQGQGDTSLAL